MIDRTTILRAAYRAVNVDPDEMEQSERGNAQSAYMRASRSTSHLATHPRDDSSNHSASPPSGSPPPAYEASTPPPRYEYRSVPVAEGLQGSAYNESEASDDSQRTSFEGVDEHNQSSSGESNRQTEDEFRCADYDCCHDRGCVLITAQPCPGFPDRIGIAADGSEHGPGIATQSLICDDCKNHGQAEKTRQIHDRHDDRYFGHMIQLCHDCINDEMELYWQRQAQPQPTGPDAAQSLQNIEQWPAANGVQNLCTCQALAIDQYRHHCHRCRKIGFSRHHESEYMLTKYILEHHHKSVVTGQKKCGGTKDYRVSQEEVDARKAAGVTLLCPCGKSAKRPEPNLLNEYINMCGSCMGVFVDPARLPSQYRQAGMVPRRRSPRNHSRTKGKMRVQRKWQYRVNIERGWKKHDDFIGGA